VGRTFLPDAFDVGVEVGVAIDLDLAHVRNGQECLSHTCNFKIKGKGNTNPKIKSVGQECPTHQGNCNINGKGNTNPKVKSVGQECPTHTDKTKGKSNRNCNAANQGLSPKTSPSGC
jgi:hypothetical protein